MQLNTSHAPHIHGRTSVTAIMLNVVLAMVPAMIVYIWFFGWGLVVHIVIAIVTAWLCEAMVLRLRKKPVTPALMDGSALVTAILIAFCIPPFAPWWVTFLGTAFAIIIAKQLYGGLGYNPFNPAMVGYVMLLISFPREMTAWIHPADFAQLNTGLLDMINNIFSSTPRPDTVSMASPLDSLKTEAGKGHSVSDLQAGNNLFGLFAGAGWEWINAAFAAGGMWLLYKKIIHWHIPVMLLLALCLLSTSFYFIDANTYASPLIHLFSGATMIGAFFIATDPVTACTTNKGRLIYAAGIGILTYVIRAWGGYPDAIAFAVLLMNIAVPIIDYYTKPNAFGHRNK